MQVADENNIEFNAGLSAPSTSALPAKPELERNDSLQRRLAELKSNTK